MMSSEDSSYLIGDGVTRANSIRPYERKPTDPIYRPLKIFALDPSFSRLEGATALVNVPYEPLEEPGPRGRIFMVDGGCPELSGNKYTAVKLDSPEVLIRNGRDPS